MKIVPSEPITIGIIVTFMFHSLFYFYYCYYHYYFKFFTPVLANRISLGRLVITQVFRTLLSTLTVLKNTVVRMVIIYYYYESLFTSVLADGFSLEYIIIS